ncbi:MAG: hypothetical protein NC299_09435 [Lachnospiraceae bacterium]|nr:hypothetical protein [Ruminococcus sp.]MCM1275576.1 hypothetical protein [Lachnospiraceae bacterium]
MEISFEELNERWQEAYTANPRVYEHEDGTIIVGFALTEDTDSLFPLAPEKQWAIEGKTIGKWIISIVSLTENGAVLGTMEYHRAMERLKPYFLADKDGWTLIAGLTHEQLEELFEGLPRNVV